MVDEGTRLRSDEESDDSHESEISAGPQLEPRRPHSAETPIQDIAAADLDAINEDFTQADGDPTLVACEISREPTGATAIVVPYPSQNVGNSAGARIRAQDDLHSAHANVSYELEIAQDEMNPYAPFCVANGLGYCQMGQITWPGVHSVW